MRPPRIEELRLNIDHNHLFSNFYPVWKELYYDVVYLCFLPLEPILKNFRVCKQGIPF